MSVILALDPGTDQTGWVEFSGARVLDCGVDTNEAILHRLAHPQRAQVLAIEMFSSFGMPVGKEVFETCVWIGEFRNEWRRQGIGEARLVYRRDVKLHLCGSSRAKDPNVRAALLDLFPRTGGGATPQIGTKHAPGPLHGVSTHAWPALGVAVLVAHQLGTLKVSDAPMFRKPQEVAFP